VDFEEVHRFLDTWYFFISDCGFLYARPRKNRISLSDFRSFVKRLDMVCHGEVPSMIVVDLSDLPSKLRFWMKCKPLICKFSRRTSSLARFECHGGHAAVVIWRRGSSAPRKSLMQAALTAVESCEQSAAS